MGLKAILSSLEGVHEEVAKLYKKGDDGKFHLDVEGLVDKGKLDEFRSNNTSLKADLEAKMAELAKYAGIDPLKYKELMDKVKNEEEKKLLGEGKLEEVVQQRIESMRKDFEDKLAAKDKAIAKAEEDRKSALGERDSYIVESELRRAVDNPDLGFHQGVFDLVKNQVHKEFVYKDGKVTRVKQDGSPVFGPKGEPGTIGEFLTEVAKLSPYLVKGSTGGGARPGQNGVPPGTKTMRRADFDQLAPQAKMDFSKEKGVLVD